MWRGGFRLGISVTGPFGRRCLTSFAMAPFPHPAHQTRRAVFPHRAFGQGYTHILLHTFAHEQLPLRPWKPVKSQLPVQMLVGEPCCSLTPYLEFHAQPLTHPIAEVAVDGPIGLAYRSKAKVVRPTLYLAVDPYYLHLDGSPSHL